MQCSTTITMEYELLTPDELGALEDQETLLMILALFLVEQMIPKERNSYVVLRRLDWTQHVNKLHLRSPKAFHSLYRMSYESFVELCDILRPSLRVNREMSRRRTSTEPIDAKIILATTLRWLSGGDYITTSYMMGISVSTFYRITEKCLRAIVNNERLRIRFPTTDEEIREVARGFSAMSTDRVMTGCVGCLDGYLIRTQCPRLSDAGNGNVRSFFNGHYYHYGVNVQACCDHRCRFISVCIAMPGGQPDVSAHRVNPLAKLIEKLPLGYFIAGDNAYTNSEHLLTPFSGTHKEDTRLGNFNFYLSQLRITVERAFGLVTSRFRILKAPLMHKLWKIKLIFMASTVLQNFCINRRDEEFFVDLAPNENVDGPYDPFIDEPFQYSDHVDLPGESALRRLLVAKIDRRGLSRPHQSRSVLD